MKSLRMHKKTFIFVHVHMLFDLKRRYHITNIISEEQNENVFEIGSIVFDAALCLSA